MFCDIHVCEWQRVLCSGYDLLHSCGSMEFFLVHIYISEQGQLMFCQSAMPEVLASNGDLTGDCLSGLCSLFALCS